jgi:hypothetical protein
MRACVRTSERPSGVSGVVIDSRGKPVTRPFLSFSSDWFPEAGPGDESGRFAFDDATAGDYLLFAASDDEEARVSITFAPGERLDGLVVQLQPAPPVELEEPIGLVDAPTNDAPDPLPPRVPAWMEREITVVNTDELGRSMALAQYEIHRSTWNQDGSIRIAVMRGPEEPSGATLVTAPAERTAVCPSLWGYLVDCTWVEEGQNVVMARWLRAGMVAGVIRGVPDETVIRCAGREALTHDNGAFRITCPPGPVVLEVEADRTLRIPVETRPGMTLSLEAQIEPTRP